MKMASRKISLRIITLYILCVLTASFLVPTDHPFINGEGQSTGSRSIFVIAAVEAGLPALGQFFNAMFLFSAATCAADNLYVASRVLHTLALRDQTGPEFITRRLRQCRAGVPMRAVLLSAAVMLVAYLGPTGATGAVSIDQLNGRAFPYLTPYTETQRVVFQLYCFIPNCLRYYLRDIPMLLPSVRTHDPLVTPAPKTTTDHHRLDEAKQYGNTSQTQAATYDRNHVRYPYKSHAQWLKAGFGMVACIILLLFNGVDSFLTTPFDARTFIASYISVCRSPQQPHEEIANHPDSGLSLACRLLQDPQTWI
jgi:amino acid transporter